MSWLLPLLGFLLGSIPFGLLMGKIKGIDIRQHGSGNIGATNVFRILGKQSGITCLLLDFTKGLVPVLIARNMVEPMLAEQQFTAQSIEVLTALASIMGHNYSPWIGFKGGKGIATTAGAITALMPFGLVLLILVWAIFTFTTKYVSVGSIAAAASLPILVITGSAYHGKLANGTWNKPLFIFSLIAAILAIWKHRANIARLKAGTENHIGQKKKEDSA
ncbi:MAG: acyl-phosphate glycerol 3-phosphate acyltransferase [Verrucomicrobiaceae bacterium TMED86]|nr:MAG: acyl-phosphate glycerol 3-phosphate acyltransferase [Verrucomicrobiaceae bacterium TMED86]